GEDGFRARQKLNQIIQEYQAKHQTGLNLARFGEKNLEFDKFREKIEAVSMFDEKKLIILENIFNQKDFLEQFSKYLKKNKLKDNQEIIIVIHQAGKLPKPAFKRQVNMFEEFQLLQGVKLVDWLKKEVSKNKGEISPGAINKLIIYVGNDLWQLFNELNKLISFKAGQIIEEKDVDLLVKARIDVNIFKTLDALAQRDKKTAFKLIHQHLEQGENEIYLLSMLAYQVRTLIKLKDLVEKGTPYYNLARKAGLHPFVVKKSSQQLRNFTLEQLKKIYRYLLEIDWKIKVGRLDGQTALDLLVGEI
ncbi:MAG: DNA polymerase III subunit delta, partial [Patescibacteria group bacterium]